MPLPWPVKIPYSCIGYPYMKSDGSFSRIGVVGAGNMGASIAEVMAFNGYDVVMKDQNDELIQRGMKKIRDIVSSQVRYQEGRYKKEVDRIRLLGIELTNDQQDVLKQKMKPEFTEADAEKVLSRIHTTVDYSEMSDVDFVIEAAFENLDVKRDIFRSLSSVVGENTILASNTSSLSITAIASGTGNPSRVIITHFFNPPFTLPLVEVVKGLKTSYETEKRTMDFIGGLHNHRRQMVPISVKENPGFVVNRMLVPMLNEAVFLMQEGVASARDIDTAMKLGAGMPMGPLELLDMVGLDVTLDVCNVLQHDFGDQKYRPSILLQKMVEAGLFGKKSGEGFYKY